MNTIQKILFVILGTVSLILGVIGVFVPLLPTTPFLLLSAFLFARSSDRLYTWLLTHKRYGEYITNYTQHKSMKKATKHRTIVLLWCTMVISMYLVNVIYATVTLIVIGSLVTLHILSLGTIDS